MPRPLSRWVARLSDGTSELGAVNDGRDRTDARVDPQFASGWERSGLGTPESGTELVLALVNQTTGATVVELDSLGRPLLISPSALGTLKELESSWPGVNRWESVAEFATEDLAVRHALLDRLAAEADPPPEVFHILPWDRVESLVQGVVGTLSNGHASGPLIELRHWFTSAVRGVTGPLEQLDHGLRTQRPDVARQGSSALISNLLFVNSDRLPARTRAELVELVGRVASYDPVSRHAAAVARRKLQRGAADPHSTAHIDRRMTAAAADNNLRQTVIELGDEYQQVQLTITRGGTLEIVVELPVPVDAAGPLGRRGALFLPVRLRAEDGRPPAWYWIGLVPGEDELSGMLEVRLPPGTTTVECDDVPVGAAELASQPPELLLNSFELSVPSIRAVWRAAAAQLAPEHAVRRALRMFDGDQE